MKFNIKMKLVATAACGLLLSSVAQGAEVKVLASGAVKEAALDCFRHLKASDNTSRRYLGRHRRHQEEDRGWRGVRSRHRCEPRARHLHEGRQDRCRQQGGSGEIQHWRRKAGAPSLISTGDDVKKTCWPPNRSAIDWAERHLSRQPVRAVGKADHTIEDHPRAGRIPDQGAAKRSASAGQRADPKLASTSGRSRTFRTLR
jgi:hypothetical protein